MPLTDAAKAVGVSARSIGRYTSGVDGIVKDVSKRFKRGEKPHATKLTEERVKQARSMAIAGTSYSKIAVVMKCHINTIGMAIRGETWADIPGAIKKQRDAA